VARQREEIERHERYESMALPNDLDYREVRGLSIEVQQKLNQHRPETIGQASRVSGITPAAISLLLVPEAERGSTAEVGRMTALAAAPDREPRRLLERVSPKGLVSTLACSESPGHLELLEAGTECTTLHPYATHLKR
jgi:hypothetical protein